MKFKNYLNEKQIQMGWQLTRDMEDFNMEFYNDELDIDNLYTELMGKYGDSVEFRGTKEAKLLKKIKGRVFDIGEIMIDEVEKKYIAYKMDDF